MLGAGERERPGRGRRGEAERKSKAGVRKINQRRRERGGRLSTIKSPGGGGRRDGRTGVKKKLASGRRPVRVAGDVFFRQVRPWARPHDAGVFYLDQGKSDGFREQTLAGQRVQSVVVAVFLQSLSQFFLSCVESMVDAPPGGRPVRGTLRERVEASSHGIWAPAVRVLDRSGELKSSVARG